MLNKPDKPRELRDLDWAGNPDAIFSTPIHRHQAIFDDNIDLQKEANWLLGKVEQKGFSKHPGWEHDTHSLSDPSFSENVLYKYRALKLIDFIHREAGYYLRGLGHSEEAGFLGMKIVSSWLTKTMPGEYARLHDHGTTDIAGVYYIKGNPNTDGNLYFQDHDKVKTHGQLLRCVPYQQDYPPGEASLILFPGWVLHGTRIHQGTEPRISLSFNIKIETTLG